MAGTQHRDTLHRANAHARSSSHRVSPIRPK